MTEELKHVLFADINIVKGFNVRGRGRFKGPDFDELVESIKTQGILQPVLLRPNGKDYELIAGERRIKAAKKAAKGNGGVKELQIPALVREMTDDQAIEFMLTENIQRDDLTPLEEAEGFKRYIDNVEDADINVIADRCGKPAPYVQKRIKVLELPKKVLQAWNKGFLSYGHLEQFIRIEPSVALKLFNEMVDDHESYGRKTSVDQLRRSINNFSPQLKNAKFKTKEAGCTQCPHNSDIQKSLFAKDDIENMSCLKPDCFAEKQGEHLTKHWKKTGYYKDHKTTGFEFNEQVDRDAYREFGFGDGSLKEKCASCDYFKSVIRLDGSVWAQKACFGEESCFNAKEKQAPKDPQAQATLDMQAKKERTQQRSQKHGVEFREIHFETSIPKKIQAIKSNNEKSYRLSLIAIISARPELHEKLNEDFKLGGSKWFRMGDKDIVDFVNGLDISSVKQLLQTTAVETIMSSGFSASGRFKIADLVGVDLQAEWMITEDFLKKKQKAEIITLLNDDKFKIAERPEIKDYLGQTLGNGSFEVCKKGELIDLLIKSGTDLAGIVPEEILKDS